LEKFCCSALVIEDFLGHRIDALGGNIPDSASLEGVLEGQVEFFLVLGIGSERHLRIFLGGLVATFTGYCSGNRYCSGKRTKRGAIAKSNQLRRNLLFYFDSM
jgi:hypothetical protein